MQSSSRNINHDKKHVKDKRKSLMAVKKAAEKLRLRARGDASKTTYSAINAANYPTSAVSINRRHSAANRHRHFSIRKPLACFLRSPCF